MMDPVLTPFGEIMRAVKLVPPRLPILSTVSASWLTPEQATDPDYWTGHLRATVRFADALAAVVRETRPVLLEVGPRNTLTTLARQQSANNAPAIGSLEESKDGQGEWAAFLSAAGRLWLDGAALDWGRLHPTPRRRVPLPTYPFQRQRYWVDSATRSVDFQPAELLDDNISAVPGYPDPLLTSAPVPSEVNAMTGPRKQRLVSEVCALLEESSGRAIAAADGERSFFELGLDSLLLTQACLLVARKYSVPVTFRQLMDDLSSPDRLADYLDKRLPKEAMPAALPKAPDAAPVPADVQDLINRQLQIMARQLELLGGSSSRVPSTTTGERNGTHDNSVKPSAVAVASEAGSNRSARARRLLSINKAPFRPSARSGFADITKRYNARTKTSKEYTQRQRAVLADPRVVSGFRPETKELVYPIVVKRSQGCKLIDLDDNEYIDITCGFGSNMFGYSSPFITQRLAAQIESGYEIGPQHPLAGVVADKISRFTGLPRVIFCNTGSEAVLGAVRLARTVTGRDTVAVFNGSYHGIVDEVIFRPGKHGKAMPAAAGITASAVQNLLLLDYGSPQALQTLRERAGELAAVLVEPVQSRHPDLQPRDFLHEVRKITAAAGTALIFDEVITGFRLLPGGAQAWFDITADLATYGKVVGGGLPIGVIAGQDRFMDALDGGSWNYGDASFPEAGVTYFAGTFVRHPLALAAADAGLSRTWRGSRVRPFMRP